MKRPLLPFLLTAVALSAGPTTSSLAGELESAFAESGLRGAAVVMVRDERTESLFFGEALPASRFRVGSLSKLVTALLAMRAVEAGVAELDAPLAPPFSGWIEGPGEPSLAMLLEHSAGLPGSSYAEYAAQGDDLRPVDYVRSQAPIPLRWAPGHHYSYSNLGITLAAAVLEEAWGVPFDLLMEREVFQPLGLKDSTFSVHAEERVLPSWNGPQPAARWKMPVRPAGSLVSSAGDLQRLLEMLLARGLTSGGERFLSRESLERLERGETSAAARAGVDAYGLGNFAFWEAGRLWRGHWGRTEGFLSCLAYLPEEGRGFLVLANEADRKGMARLREAAADWASRDLPQLTLPPSRALRSRVDQGWYRNYSHDMPLRAWLASLLDVRRITPSQDHLLVRGWFGPAQPWESVGPNQFRAPSLLVATGCFHEQGGEIFWIDGESYRRSSFAWLLGELILFLLGLALSLPAFLLLLVAGVRQIRGQPPSAATWLLGVGGLLPLALLAGFARWGLLGEAGTLGRPGWEALSLLGLSLGGAILSLLVALLARRKGWGYRTMAGILLGFFGLLALRGWVPLLTWL
ncbi:MAG: serine hydrolase domain-containing protein [Verrucomicrobiota bacterium]